MDWFLYDNGPRHKRVKTPEVHQLVKNHVNLASHFGDITELLFRLLCVWRLPPDYILQNRGNIWSFTLGVLTNLKS